MYIDVLGVKSNKVESLKKSDQFKDLSEKVEFYKEISTEDGEVIFLTKPNRGTFFNLRELNDLLDSDDFIYVSSDDEGGIELGGELSANTLGISVSGSVSFVISKQSEERIEELKAFHSDAVFEDEKLQELADLSVNNPDKFGDAEEELAYELLEKYGLEHEDFEHLFSEDSVQRFCQEIELDTDYSKAPYFIATFFSDDLIKLNTRIEDFKDELLEDQVDEDEEWLDDDDYASRTIAGLDNDELMYQVEEEYVAPNGASLLSGFEIQVREGGKLYRTYSECDWYEGEE